MKARLCSFVMTISLLTAIPSYALEPFALYDDFTATVLNPVKWYGGEFFGRGTEALRMVQTGKLCMLYRSWANRGSNSGTRPSALSLALLHKASLITELKATVRVTSSTAVNCVANTAAGGARAGLQGSFFNTDTAQPGASSDDMRAGIAVFSSVTEPGILHVRSFVYQCHDTACLITTTLDSDDLGTVSVNTDVTLQLQWDPANNKFLFQRDALAPISSIYTGPDSEKPGFGFKTLEIVGFPENCIANPRPQTFMDATFDNVQVNQSAQ